MSGVSGTLMMNGASGRPRRLGEEPPEAGPKRKRVDVGPFAKAPTVGEAVTQTAREGGTDAVTPQAQTGIRESQRRQTFNAPRTTILTSPLGLLGQARTAYRTLLGG